MSANNNSVKNNTADNSDIKSAANNVDVDQLDKNLSEDKVNNTPEPLKNEEETPFIDKSLRTDE